MAEQQHPSEMVALILDDNTTMEENAGLWSDMEAVVQSNGASGSHSCRKRWSISCAALLLMTGLAYGGAAWAKRSRAGALVGPTSAMGASAGLVDANFGEVVSLAEVVEVEDCLDTGYLRFKGVLFDNMCGVGPDEGHDGLIVEVEIVPPPAPTPAPTPAHTPLPLTPAPTPEHLEWHIQEGLPPDEGDDLDLDISGVSSLQNMKDLCEDHPECVGFATWPDKKKYHPKKVGTGFNAGTATYSQYKEGELWLWLYIVSRGYVRAQQPASAEPKSEGTEPKAEDTHLSSAGLVPESVLALSITALSGDCLGGKIQGDKGLALKMAPGSEVTLDVRLIDYAANRTVLIPRNYLTLLDFGESPALATVVPKLQSQERRLADKEAGKNVAIGSLYAEGFKEVHISNETEIEHETKGDMGVAFRIQEASPKSGPVDVSNLSPAQKARAIEFVFEDFKKTTLKLDIEGGDAESYTFLFALHASVDCNAVLGGIVPWQHNAGAIDAPFWLRFVCCMTAFATMFFCGYITPRYEQEGHAEDVATRS